MNNDQPAKRRGARWLLAAASLALSGCSTLLRDTPTPIPTRTITMAPTAHGRTLVVFLPGRGGSMDDFERHGMTAVLREAGIEADAVAVDAHLNYYYKRTVIERLRADVIQPALERGYSRVVMVGVSLGGLGTLLYEREHPGMIDAIVLLAPYLGDQASLFETIAAAGGPAAWAAGRDNQEGRVEEQLWAFLGRQSSTLPPTWLLAGHSDWLGRGHRLFATLLPPARVKFIAGSHDWKTWNTLWREVCLNSDLFTAEKSMKDLEASAPLPETRGASARPPLGRKVLR